MANNKVVTQMTVTEKWPEGDLSWDSGFGKGVVYRIARSITTD